MKNVPWLSAVLLLLFTANARAADKSCELKRYATIDLVVTEHNVFVPVTMNGTSGLMRLNTSSAFTHVWQHQIEPLKLGRKKLNVESEVRFGEQRVRELAVLDSFAIGDANFGKATFVAPSHKDGTTEIFGGLGMEIFSRVDFELDLARSKLILYSQDHCPGNVVYWTDEYATAPLYRGKLGEFYFPVELEGKKVEATFAPDDSVSTLNVDVTKRLYGFDETSSGIEHEEVAGRPVMHYRAMQLTAPGLEVKDTKIHLLPSKPKCVLQVRGRKGGGAGYGEECLGAYPMRLGSNILRKLRLYFATRENKVYFTAADAGQDPR